MDSFITFLCEYAKQAPWIFFLLLLLTGCGIPLSEDLLVLTAGMIVSVCIPDHFFKLFIWVYLGAWFSAWIAYGIGRYFGERLYEFHWFKHFITKKRIEKLQRVYERFGVFTFIIGRFFPGGIRNALFITSGIGKMAFHKFILRDAIGCLISVSVLFNLGYFFGSHYKTIIHYIKTYDIIGIIILTFAILLFVWMRFRKHVKL